jgi:carbonic anhydrase
MLFEAFLGLNRIIVIHHTGELSILFGHGKSYNLNLFSDCGASQFKDADIRKFHKDRLPDHSEIDHMVFGAFDK